MPEYDRPIVLLEKQAAGKQERNNLMACLLESMILSEMGSLNSMNNLIH